ncbi:antibiotic biosynthesis monooxygenase [Actinocrinis puniceicyclus]|uniref:Antibiotic biosynthesis monooxygenase n=1 Tax=Actinocrinis puniceicyclus TaxID=977794 RepID=A0A8J7WN02_9ACTN|nr:antibiotic biosynthesis monooxygenase [Actinocrinis puniceicyclus]MBS2965353.1 antibiotic biosynthesis monooxygenase [Actinocrinis puniceicyclus]
MVIEYIRYRLPGEREEGFVAAYETACESLRAAPECVGFELSRCVEEPSCYILRIRWTSVKAHLEGFRGGPHFAAFFRAVRPFVADIEEMRHYEATGVRGDAGAAPTSLYAWAGGTEAFIELCDAFYRLVRADDLLGPMFASMDPQHARYVALWIAEVFGGPPVYSEQRGGYEPMVQRHLGRGITEPQRRRWVNLMMDAADEVGLPADPEFRAAFASYLEWGSRLALHNSQPGADVAHGAPVPKWGWGVAPPYQG